MGFMQKEAHRVAGQPMPGSLYLKMIDAEKADYIVVSFDLPAASVFMDRLEPVKHLQTASRTYH